MIVFIGERLINIMGIAAGTVRDLGPEVGPGPVTIDTVKTGLGLGTGNGIGPGTGTGRLPRTNL